MPNRMFIGVPMYGAVYPRFYMNYMGFIARVARAQREAGFSAAVPILTMQMPYIDHADTAIVNSALKQDETWDYLCLVEHDNIQPDDWADVVTNQLDPEIHKIVGRWYFGKAQEDMRSICGYLRPNGDFDRLSYDQVQQFRANRGLYRVGVGMEGVDDSADSFVVGMGCTAIHRSVFEYWMRDVHPDGQRKVVAPMPWFQSVSSWREAENKMGYLGHDVNFCMWAHKQGIDVWIDTRKASGHVGDFVSDDETYTATVQNMINKGAVTSEALAGAPNKQALNPDGIPTAMSTPELEQLAALAKGKRVLEIGSRLGASTISMAGYGAEVVFALDWHRGDVWHEGDGKGDTLDVFWRYVGKYGQRDKVVPLVGKSDQVLPTLSDQQFDLVFIDGDHSYEGCSYDILQALRLVKPGGHIAIHDYGREKMLGDYKDTDQEIGITRAVDELLGSPPELIDTLAVFTAAIPIAA